MTAAIKLLSNPELPGPICMAITPDKEIGHSIHENLPKDLQVDCTCTFDSSAVGEVEYETFSADRAIVTILGISIHLGRAKDKMVNATHLVSKILQTLPQATMTPKTIDGRQGFIHLADMSDGSSQMDLKFILRDFERGVLGLKGVLLRNVCNVVQTGKPSPEIRCRIYPQYSNMHYWLEDDMTSVNNAFNAAKALGIKAVSVPIRGGTDGSCLTELGVPTPNLYTRMQNIHGLLAWISV